MIFSVMIYLSFILCLVGIHVLTLLLLGRKNKRLQIIVSAAASCFLLWLLFSLKGAGTGSDTQSYVSLYESVKGDTLFLKNTLSGSVHFEVGFLIFVSFIAHTGLPYIFFQMFVYSIICSSLFFASYKLSKNPAYSIFIFFTFTFYNFFISGLRQSLSISLCLFALTFVLSRKKDYLSYIIYFLVVAFASAMHNSAILFFPVIFLTNIKMSQNKLLVLIFGTILFYIFGFQIYNIIITVASLTNLVYTEGYVAYSGGFGKIPILMLLLTIFSFFVLYPTILSDKIAPKLLDRMKIKKDIFSLESLKNNEQPTGTGLFIVLMFIGCCFDFLNRFSSGIGRGSMFFTIVCIILIPNALENFENKIVKVVVESLFFIGFVGFLFYYSISTNIMNFAYEFYF